MTMIQDKLKIIRPKVEEARRELDSERGKESTNSTQLEQPKKKKSRSKTPNKGSSKTFMYVAGAVIAIGVAAFVGAQMLKRNK
jgi:hypothetical protein